MPTTTINNSNGQKVITIMLEVPESKAVNLVTLSKLSAETLAILAEKSKKPGMEEKLKKYQFLI